jgi:hypothetical protein
MYSRKLIFDAFRRKGVSVAILIFLLPSAKRRRASTERSPQWLNVMLG